MTTTPIKEIVLGISFEKLPSEEQFKLFTKTASYAKDFAEVDESRNKIIIHLKNKQAVLILQNGMFLMHTFIYQKFDELVNIFEYYWHPFEQSCLPPQHKINEIAARYLNVIEMNGEATPKDFITINTSHPFQEHDIYKSQIRIPSTKSTPINTQINVTIPKLERKIYLDLAFSEYVENQAEKDVKTLFNNIKIYKNTFYWQCITEHTKQLYHGSN